MGRDISSSVIAVIVFVLSISFDLVVCDAPSSSSQFRVIGSLNGSEIINFSSPYTLIATEANIGLLINASSDAYVLWTMDLHTAEQDGFTEAIWSDHGGVKHEPALARAIAGKYVINSNGTLMGLVSIDEVDILYVNVEFFGIDRQQGGLEPSVLPPLAVYIGSSFLVQRMNTIQIDASDDLTVIYLSFGTTEFVPSSIVFVSKIENGDWMTSSIHLRAENSSLPNPFGTFLATDSTGRILVTSEVFTGRYSKISAYQVGTPNPADSAGVFVLLGNPHIIRWNGSDPESKYQPLYPRLSKDGTRLMTSYSSMSNAGRNANNTSRGQVRIYTIDLELGVLEHDEIDAFSIKGSPFPLDRNTTILMSNGTLGFSQRFLVDTEFPGMGQTLLIDYREELNVNYTTQPHSAWSRGYFVMTMVADWNVDTNEYEVTQVLEIQPETDPNRVSGLSGNSVHVSEDTSIMITVRFDNSLFDVNRTSRYDLVAYQRQVVRSTPTPTPTPTQLPMANVTCQTSQLALNDCVAHCAPPADYCDKVKCKIYCLNRLHCLTAAHVLKCEDYVNTTNTGCGVNCSGANSFLVMSFVDFNFILMLSFLAVIVVTCVSF